MAISQAQNGETRQYEERPDAVIRDEQTQRYEKSKKPSGDFLFPIHASPLP
jgi:hypothetical protein